jgi:UDP-2,3-diacylglucosamine pyrophosphatase LpxH
MTSHKEQNRMPETDDMVIQTCGCFHHKEIVHVAGHCESAYDPKYLGCGDWEDSRLRPP